MYAASIAGGGFTEYSHTVSLPGGSSLTPPAGTIVFSAFINAALALRVHFDTYRLTPHVSDNYHYGVFGGIYCDGTHINFYNNNSTTKTLTVFGVTI